MNDIKRLCYLAAGTLLPAAASIAPILRFLAWLFVPDVGAQALLTSVHVLQWKSYFMYMTLLYRPRTALLFMYLYDRSYLLSIASYFGVNIDSWKFWVLWLASPGIVLSYLTLAVCHGLNMLTQFTPCFHLFVVYLCSLLNAHAELSQLYSFNFSMPNKNSLLALRKPTLICVTLCLCPYFLWTPLLYMIQLLFMGLICIVLAFFAVLFLSLLMYILDKRSISAGYDSWKQAIYRSRSNENGSTTTTNNRDSAGALREMLLRALDINTGTERAAAQLPASLQLPELSDEQEEQLPPELICPTCKSLLNVPVIVPSGCSYCKQCILDSLSANNYFDPVTRESLTQDDLRFNRGLHDAALRWCKQMGIEVT